MRHGALALLALLALNGCETTAQRSARLERRAHHVSLSQRGLSIAKVSREVRVLGTAVLSGQEAVAAVVTVRNTSKHPLRAVPIAITVKDARGGVLYRNDAPGLAPSLVSIPLLAPGARLTWIDDQVQSSGAPASVGARVGEAPRASAAVPQMRVGGLRLTEEAAGAGAEGTVSNRSTVPQSDLVVYVLARRAGRIVAAGRAVLPALGAHASEPFQAYFVGDPHGARLTASAPATTLG